MQFAQSLLFLLLVERLAVPALFILQEGDTLTLYGLSDNHSRRAVGLYGLCECLVDLVIVMPVNHDSVPAEAIGACLIGGGVPAQFGFAALPQAIAVEYSNQVIQLVMRGVIEGFPDRTFCHLAITQQNPDMIEQFVKVFADQPYTHANRQTLPQ